MRIFYINVDSRSDRREFMESQFARLGLKAERVSAVTPSELSDSQRKFCDPKRLNWVSATEAACIASHRAVWSRVEQLELPVAVVLEDDACLSDALPARLDQLDRVASTYDVVRFETRGNRVLLKEAEAGLYRFFSSQYGAAGYIVSRAGASKLLRHEVLDVPLDDLLFDTRSPMFRVLSIRQTVPALCITLDTLSVATLNAVAGSSIALDSKARTALMSASRSRPSTRLRAGLVQVSGRAWNSIVRRFGESTGGSWSEIPILDLPDPASIHLPGSMPAARDHRG